MITRIFQSSCWWNSSCQCTSILGLALFFWILLYQLLLHQDFFLVLHLAVLRDLGVAVELQLVVTVLRLPWLVVGVLVGVVVGQGHLAELLLRGVGHGARLEVLKRDGDEGNQLCC